MLSVVAMVILAALEPLLPALMKPLVDESLIAKDPTSLWTIPLFILLVFLAKGVVDYISNVSTQWVAQRVVADIREQLFLHQLMLPAVDQWKAGVGVQISRVTYDTQQVAAAVSTAWLTVIRDSLILVALLTYLLILEWRLTLVIFMLAPVVAWLISVAARRLKKSNQLLQHAMGRLNTVLQQGYRGVTEIKLFSAERLYEKKFRQISQNVRAESMRAIRIQAMNVPIVQVFAAMAVSVALLVASYLSSENELTPGEFVSFVAALAMIFEPIRRLTNINAVIQRGLAAAEAIFGVLDRPIEPLLSSASERDDTSEKAGDSTIGKPFFLESENLSFSYPGEPEKAFKGVDLKIKSGDAIAFVGASGSGKTTFTQIVSGLHRDYGGSLYLRGVNAAALSANQHRHFFSVLCQSPTVFDGSISENITMAEPQCLTRLHNAIERAQLTGYVESSQLGVDTLLGVDGIGMSGGQLQRLGLARALYRQAECLILDEATSALDPINQDLVWRVLRDLKGSVTLLLVAHQPQRLKWVDRILVFQAGRVVEDGSYDELMKRGGVFTKMVNDSAFSVGG